MKRYLVGVAMVLGLAAGYSPLSQGAPCVIGTLASYIALGTTGCTIDDKTFSNFFYSATQSGGTALPTATQVTVTPVIANDELIFSGAFLIDAGQTGDVALAFSVAMNPGATNLIDDLNVTLTGTNFGGTGAVTDTTVINCPIGGASCGNADITLAAPTHHFTFTPTSSIRVTEDTVLKGGTLGADFSIVDKVVSQTGAPEPTSLALLGIGLAGLAALRRRKALH